MKDFIVFGQPRIEEEEINEVVDSLKSAWIGTGPKVQIFEENFKKYIGSEYALAVNSCTSALHLSLLMADIKQGDEVITTPMTFVATANAIIHTGAKPVFIDIDEKTMNIDENKIEEKITEKTKAIIPVHFAGRPCNMDAISELKEKYDLKIIEDAAHAIESKYKNKKIGNIGDSACFSFYATKNITTGEGGIITTNNDEWAEKISVMRLHGLSKDAWKRYSNEESGEYQAIYPGYKYNMTDIQAALGIHQLKKINKFQEIRKNIWNTYNEEFANLPITLPLDEEKNTIHAKHLYTILLNPEANISREKFRKELYQRGIGTGIHFISVHLHPYYKKTFNFKEEDFPISNNISKRTVSIPLTSKLNEEEVNRITTAVKEILK